jgi:hypothetical protein
LPSKVSSIKTNAKTDSTEDSTRNRKLVASISIVLIVAASLLGAYFLLNSASSPLPTAAIIDQVSSSQLSDPPSRHVNETLINTAKSLLYTRFSQVDYYSDNATVDFYRLLPSKGYKLIVWSAHSALDEQSNFVAISSSENNKSKNYDQYSSEELTLCNISGDSRLYFAITPTFVKDRMEGRFDDTIIILMTCNGLKDGYYSIADALVEKGAKVVISWDGWVSFSDDDAVLPKLLQYLIIDNNTIGEAVAKIPSTYDPVYGPSHLHSWPDSADNYRIPDYGRVGKMSTLIAMSVPIRRKAKLALYT